ncbi:MAG: methylmalonyl Co-A mutase-associated GTPase MeaB [Gammaproteobacteria bacterium]|nr:methylmalonyl Co-A mutase-associated GTPase MeaB [Gammaproteobacteria bacterium]
MSDINSEDLANGIKRGDRVALSKAITLIESTLPVHTAQAQSLLKIVMSDTGQAIRLGISGVPGVGKSTLIETLGMQLIEQGHRVAVLAIDPSSQRTGGSILGDKTRMSQLSKHPQAFVRPSPSSGHLGGVTRMTRESLLLCEAAGFDVVLVETVGVGQSETAVADMVDCYCLLMLPGAGDDLQGIKKGALELADIIAVNKADGDRQIAAGHAKTAYSRALSILQPTSSWQPVALTCSAETGNGVQELWQCVLEHRSALEKTGELQSLRQEQRLRWLWSMIENKLMAQLHSKDDLRSLITEVENDIKSGRLTVPVGCDKILAAMGQ